MIWRPARAEDRDAVVALSREPMPGGVRLIWGFTEPRAPDGCSGFETHVLERKGRVAGMAMRWNWPDGGRYLSGLRLSRDLKARPGRGVWTRAYRSVMEGCDTAWTTVGEDNAAARRLLESGVSWLPRYTPRQRLRTVFVPLGGARRRIAEDADRNRRLGIVPADHRFVAVASGKGFTYRLARVLHACGGPGVPAPGRRIQIGHVDGEADGGWSFLRRAARGATGLDGLVWVGNRDGMPRCPVGWAAWDSVLYEVTWDRNREETPVPDWRGAWL